MPAASFDFQLEQGSDFQIVFIAKKTDHANRFGVDISRPRKNTASIRTPFSKR